MESFTGLTPEAFARGYIVAYADHALANDPNVLTDAGSIPKLVGDKWCVDPKRVYLTGHSDGGSMAIGVEINQFSPIAAVAPSAAGVSASTLQGIPCPSPPIATMVMHSSGDQLFPVSYGTDEASWFAKCDGCMGTGGAHADGCLPRTGCADGTEVVYCQGTAPHGVWPNLNASILDFFDAHRAP
jgi:polyhydroxybutyrate depolymerase